MFILALSNDVQESVLNPLFLRKKAQRKVQNVD